MPGVERLNAAALARPYCTHVAASASGFKRGLTSLRNSKSWGSAARLYLDFPKAGCCAVSLLEPGYAAFGSVSFGLYFKIFVFCFFYHARGRLWVCDVKAYQRIMKLL